MRPLVVFLSCAGSTLGAAHASAEKPAASVSDLRDHFAGCFRPPSVTRNTRVTFYFSMNAYGGLIGRPRTTWLGYTGSERDRAKEIDAFETSFAGCLPVTLDRRMAATLPGEVYFLQFVVGPDGHDQRVLFRPFGSHGGNVPEVFGPREPVRPEAPEAPPPGRAAPAFAPHPMTGPVFDAPIALPRGPYGRSR